MTIACLFRIPHSLQLFQHRPHDLRRFGRQTLHRFFTTQTFQYVLETLPQRASIWRRVAIMLQRLCELIRLPTRLRIALRARNDEVEDVFESDTLTPALSLTPRFARSASRGRGTRSFSLRGRRLG